MILVRTLAVLAAIAMVPHMTWATPIFIQEVLYDAAGPDAREAFTELVGPPGTNLDGWTLVGVNGSSGVPYRTIDLTGASIPLDGIFLIATSSASAALAAERDFIANVDWQNGPDAVQLQNPLGVLIDALQYGSAGIHNAGEGNPAEDAPPGLALSRDASGTDTDDNAADFRATEPSPGRINAIALPEPSGLALFLVGAAALFRQKGTQKQEGGG